jgi:hypothetical protein
MGFGPCPSILPVIPTTSLQEVVDAVHERGRLDAGRRLPLIAVTDESGAYRLVDLRPGVYSLTFTLIGFSTVRRENIELSSDFTMTLNTEMKVGALGETLTVSGSAPVVDVQSTTRSQMLSRDVLDAVPTGRTIQGMGQLITPISLNVPVAGGSRAMQQTTCRPTAWDRRRRRWPSTA